MNPYHTPETAPALASAAAGGTGPSPQTRRSFLQRLTVGATVAGTGVALTSLAGMASAGGRGRDGRGKGGRQPPQPRRRPPLPGP